MCWEEEGDEEEQTNCYAISLLGLTENARLLGICTNRVCKVVVWGKCVVRPKETQKCGKNIKTISV